MNIVLACLCGHQQDAEEMPKFGTCYRCEACRTVWARLYPLGGGCAWVPIPEGTVEFFNLLGNNEEEK